MHSFILPKTIFQGRGSSLCWAALLLLQVLLLTFPAKVHAQAQYTYAVIEGTSASITGYTGSGGDITIPSMIDGLPVSSIGNSAFNGCTSLTTVIIPGSVTSIGSSAFSGCNALTSITIPTSVTSIGSLAFSLCPVLASIAVAPANSVYSSLGGVLYDKLQTTLIQCPDGIADSYTFPSSVTSIGSAAFYYSGSLTSVTIPTGVTSIGSSAFQSCTGLASVTISNSVTSIGDSAFFGCTGLTSVTIPNSVTSIGNSAFNSCSRLASVIIPNSVTSIGIAAFQSCTGLTSVTIPDSVTSIGSSVFFGCTSIASITVGPANTAYSSLNGVLFDKSQTTLIQCPVSIVGNYAIPAGVTTVADYAFAGCNALTSVTIPNSVTSIGKFALSTLSLKSAIFRGDAPLVGASIFSAANGFAVYYFDGAANFTSPVWNGYPSVNMGSYSPMSSWLVSAGFPYSADLQSTPNGDGVSLLMCYALNLNPTQNQSGSIPQLIVAGSQMSLAYYCGSPGVTYTPQISSDLINWSPSGVTISAPDANNIRTASAPVTGSSGFMRLKVDY